MGTSRQHGVREWKAETIGYKIGYKDILYDAENIANIFSNL